MNFPMNHMLSIKQYAEQEAVSTRTVNNWLAQNKLPSAQKIDGQWAIPADAKPLVKGNGDTIVIGESPDTRPQPGAAIAIPQASAATPAWLGVDVPQPPAGTSWVEAALAQLPVFVPAAQAASLLGVSKYVIEHYPEEFGAIKRGPNGGWIIPQRKIREELGIS